MRWWRRNGKRERSWRRGWKFWSGGTRRRGRGWRGLRVRCRGLRGLGGCLRRGAECEDRTQSSSRVCTMCQGGDMFVRKGMRRYVKTRTAGVRFPGRWGKRPPHPHPSEEADISNYCPANFRNRPPSKPPTLPSLALEIPDFELWLTELWNDFLIEPAPYLVASATIYLGFVLLLSQYYAAIWQLSCFLFQFVPWDDDLRYL